MAKKVTMEDIAKKVGMSKNTVSLALRNMPGINAQTRKLIFETAKQLGYEYKKNSSQNSSSDTSYKNICLIFSKDTHKSEGFFSYIQYGVESEAKKNNLNIIIYCYDENKEEFETPLSIKEGLISGIITLGRISKKTLTSILKFNLPLVIIDHYFDDLICNYVLTDNISGAYLATEYLIKLGHKDIGFSGDISAASSFYDRFQGYVKALDQYSIPYNKSFCITDKCLYEYKKDSIQRVIDEIKKIPKLPTAFFCCNDIEAITLINALKSINLSVPDDISVIGFDNIELSKNITPELTTMHISKEAMGERAVKLLLERMANPNSLCEKILLPTMFVERNSAKKIN
ncbi:LacI family DNA-binding transcriptional regulator [Acetivibrio clariflavus]|uniref:Transcriptional regulator n=1 Tax=Acetivibrio clariflavus (strain DSM 19732 / NBRC 101661 / EBR45) TaxID=720554 RepID=G8LUE9_ACECE|nr:LacI family DNA-binding transcriptional regulator [Acetivibrio clariflavus]AEV70597.1 transcriptional regulator [Acetivibrio clariflavus DSM 19732]